MTQINLEFGITPEDARRMSERLHIIGLQEVEGANQDTVRYASDLMTEVADKLEQLC